MELDGGGSVINGAKRLVKKGIDTNELFFLSLFIVKTIGVFKLDTSELGVYSNPIGQIWLVIFP